MSHHRALESPYYTKPQILFVKRLSDMNMAGVHSGCITCTSISHSAIGEGHAKVDEITAPLALPQALRPPRM